jgi:hypothetical protein
MKNKKLKNKKNKNLKLSVKLSEAPSLEAALSALGKKAQKKNQRRRGKVLWIVGYVISCDGKRGTTERNRKWGFSGVFDSEKKAVAACVDNNFFVGPANLNEVPPGPPTSTRIWPGAYFPKEKTPSSFIRVL